MTYYKTINGKRYDRALLEKTDELTAGQGDGRISEADARLLFDTSRNDKGIITTTEVRTLRYILDHYALTDQAKDWLWKQLRRQTPTQRTVQSVLQEVFGFEDMDWVIDDAVVEEHDQEYENVTTFPLALREVLEEFLTGMESTSSLRDIVCREYSINANDSEAVTAKARKLMARGVIYLFPPDFLDRIRSGELDFKYPPFVHKVEEYWPFGLRLPDLTNYYFIGFVNRANWWDVYHLGY